MLKGQPSPDQLASIADDVARLPQTTREHPSKKASADLALSNALAQATREQLTALIRDLAPEMKNKRRTDNPFVAIDLPDFIAAGGHIIISPGGTPIHVEEYRKRIEERILKIAKEHPALKAVQEGRQPSQHELIELERVLHNELKSPDIAFTDKTARAVYGLKWDNRVGFLGLIRHVLELDAVPDYESVVTQAFEKHIASERYNADQIRFLRAVHDMFLSTGRVSEDDLHDAPQLQPFGRNAVNRLLSPVQVNNLVHLTEELAV
jgi:type I restriction enzyme R subunit